MDSAASPDASTTGRALRAKFGLSDPGYDTRHMDQESGVVDEEHAFFQDKNILTKVNRHLRIIDIHEQDLTQINPRGLMVFTLSKSGLSGLLTFETAFVTIFVFIVDVTAFAQDMFSNLNWSATLICFVLLFLVKVISFFQQSPKSLRTRFILKGMSFVQTVPEIFLNCMSYGLAVSKYDYSFLAYCSACLSRVLYIDFLYSVTCLVLCNFECLFLEHSH